MLVNMNKPHSKAPALVLSAVLPLALLVVLALVLFAVPAAGAGTANGAAKAAISQVAVNGTKVTVSGRVTLPVDTAAERRLTRVVLSLIDSSGKVEQLSAKIDAKRRFKATKTTKLIGPLTVVAQVKIGGKTSGRQVRKAFAGPLSAEGGAKGGSGPGGPLSPGSGGALPPTPPPGIPPMVGLFKLEQGTQTISGQFAGTYFRMLGIQNGDSAALNKEFTLLSPGTEGGLRTDIYQPPPDPAFSEPVTGINNALANRIVQPQTFLGVKFAIATAPFDLQTGTPVPLPTIYTSEGKIGGQISYWDAQWGGESFNQGVPKPDGTYPSFNAGGEIRNSVPLSGTYDPVTSHFLMTWRSLIAEGPFGNQLGEWHLEGTFVPAT